MPGHKLNVSGHKRVWAQPCQGTIMSGHNHVWAQSCLCTIMSGHNRVWAQMCLGTSMCRNKRVWAQTCQGTNMCGHKHVWAQTCVGTNMCGHSRVGPIMYGHKRGGTVPEFSSKLQKHSFNSCPSICSPHGRSLPCPFHLSCWWLLPVSGLHVSHLGGGEEFLPGQWWRSGSHRRLFCDG